MTPQPPLNRTLAGEALGWGRVAIPGPDGGFWVYIAGPLVGGPLGSLVWQLAGERHDGNACS